MKRRTGILGVEYDDGLPEPMHYDTEYVVGLALNETLDHIVVIEKNAPHWQAGLLNGVGGHIDEGESPTTAMVREFKEETGIETHPGSWTMIGEKCGKSDRAATGKSYRVFFFYIVDNRIDALYGNPKEITEGVVQAVRMAMLRQYSAGVVCGVNWFLAMALSIIHTGEKMYAKVEYV